MLAPEVVLATSASVTERVRGVGRTGVREGPGRAPGARRRPPWPSAAVRPPGGPARRRRRAVPLPVQLDVPAGAVAAAGRALVRTVVDAYEIDPEHAPDVGIVGTPEGRRSG